MGQIKSDAGSIQYGVYYDREASKHTIMADGKEIFGRPRAEEDPVQNYNIGDTVAYQFDILVPSSFNGLTTQSSSQRYTSAAVMQFHQLGDTKPGVPFAMSLMGLQMRCTGYRKDEQWYQGIHRIVVPDEWTTWRIETKWSDGDDGWRKVYRNGELVWEQEGDTCVVDPRGAPHFRYGPQCEAWENRESNSLTFYYSNVVLEKMDTPEAPIVA